MVVANSFYIIGFFIAVLFTVFLSIFIVLLVKSLKLDKNEVKKRSQLKSWIILTGVIAGVIIFCVMGYIMLLGFVFIVAG